jgi:DUF1707 SHOCT-like domain
MVALASDGERDAAVRVLNGAFAEARLTADEHDERVSAAFAARTRHELIRLTADLPGPAHAAGPATASVPGSLDRCLLCALLICCPPAGIAWLLAARHRARTGRRQALTEVGPRSSGRGSAAVGAGVWWHAEDR